MACGDLIQSSVLDCANILQGGVGADSRLVLIQKSDVASYTANGIDQVTALTLAANKSGYSIDGVKQSLKPKFERAQAPSGQSLYKHSAEFYYFDYSQNAKNNWLRMGNGRYIAIYEHAKQDGNTFEILGLDVGLEVTEMVQAPQENGGACKIVLSSPEGELESKPPRIFDAGTGVYATNRTAVDAFLFLPTITTLSVTTYATITPTLETITGTNFFGGGSNDGVLKVEMINQLTLAVTALVKGAAGGQYQVVSNTSITYTNTASQLPVGTYKFRITTIKGVVTSAQNLILT